MDCEFRVTDNSTDKEWIEAWKLLDSGKISYTIVPSKGICSDQYHSHVRVETLAGDIAIGYSLVDAVKKLIMRS